MTLKYYSDTEAHSKPNVDEINKLGEFVSSDKISKFTNKILDDEKIVAPAVLPRFELAEQTLSLDKHQEYTISTISADSSKLLFYDAKTDKKILSVVRASNDTLYITVYTESQINFFVDIEAENIKVLAAGCPLYFADKIKANKLVLEASTVTLADQADLSAKSGVIKVTEFHQIDETVKTSLEKVSLQANKVVIEAGSFQIRDCQLQHEDFYQTGGRVLLDKSTVSTKAKFYLTEKSAFQTTGSTVCSKSSTLNAEFESQDSRFFSEQISGRHHALKAKSSTFVAKTITFDKPIHADKTLFNSDDCSIYSDCYFRGSTIVAEQLRTGEKTNLHVTDKSIVKAKVADLHNTKIIESTLTCESLMSQHLSVVRGEVQATFGICEASTDFCAASDVEIATLNLADRVSIHESTVKSTKQFTVKKNARLKVGDHSEITVQHDSKIFGDVTLDASSFTSNVLDVFGRFITTPSSSVETYRLDVYGRCALHNNSKITETFVEDSAVLSLNGEHFASNNKIANKGSIFAQGHISTPLMSMAENSLLQVTTATMSVEQFDMQAGSQFRFEELTLEGESFALGTKCLLQGTKGTIDVDSISTAKTSNIDVEEIELTGVELGLEAELKASKALLGFDRMIYGLNGGVRVKDLKIYTPLMAYSGVLDAESLASVILFNANVGKSQAWQVNEKSLFSLSTLSLPRLPDNKRDVLSSQSLRAAVNVLTKTLPKTYQAAFDFANSLYGAGELSYSYLVQLYNTYQLKSKTLSASSMNTNCKTVTQELAKDALKTAEDARTWEWLKGLSAVHAAYETATQTVESGKKLTSAIKARRVAKEKEAASKKNSESENEKIADKADSSDKSTETTADKSPAKSTRITDRLIQAAITLDKHQDTMLSLLSSVGSSNTQSSLASVNLGFNCAASINRKHGYFVNFGGEAAISSTLDAGKFYHYGYSTSMFSNLTTNAMLNQGEFTTQVADWNVGILSQRGTLAVGSDIRRSNVNIGESYRHDRSYTEFRHSDYTGDFMAATSGSHLSLHDLQGEVDHYIDAGQTTFGDVNTLCVPNYIHAGSFHQDPKCEQASLHLITDTPRLYGSADIDHLQLTIANCTRAYAQDFYVGRYHSAKYNPLRSLKLNFLDTDFTYNTATQRTSDLFVSAPQVHLMAAATHTGALGFTATKSDLAINHDIAAREVYLSSLNDSVTNHGRAVLANHYMDVRAPNGTIQGLCNVSNYQGKYDSQKIYDPAVFLGGDGAGHDGIGLYLEANNLRMEGSDLLSGGKGVAKISGDVELEALSHTYISDFKSKHYGGKSLLQKWHSWQAENLLGVDSPFYKQSMSTSTQVQACHVQSFNDQFVFDVGGKMTSTATLFDSRLGTQVFADKDVNFYSLETRDKTRTYHSKYWGLSEKKHKDIVTAARPNVLTSQAGGNVTVSSKNDIYSHGTVFYGPQADLKLVAGGNLTLERAVERHEFHEKSRGLGFSCPGYDSYQAYRKGGGWRGALGAFDPTASKIIRLCESSSTPDWLANSWNLGVNAFNTASTLGDAVQEQRLGGALMERWGLGGTQRANGSTGLFDPTFTINYQFSRKKGFSESLGSGSFDMNNVALEAGGTITTTNAFGGHARGNMDVEAASYVVKGATLKSGSTSKSEEVSVSITPSGQVTPGAGFERQKSSSRQVVNAGTHVDGNFRIRVKSLDAKNAEFHAGSMDGTKIEETKIRTTTSTSRSKGYGLSVKGTSISPSFHRTSAKTIGRQSGVYVAGDLQDADFGDAALTASVITADGENKAYFNSVKAKTVTTQSSSHELGFTLDLKALSKSGRAASAKKGVLPTIPVKFTHKTSSQRAKPVIHGATGTSPNIRGNVAGKLHMSSPKGVTSHKGFNLDVAVDVPLIGGKRVRKGVGNIQALLPEKQNGMPAGLLDSPYRVLDRFEESIESIEEDMQGLQVNLNQLSEDMDREKESRTAQEGCDDELIETEKQNKKDEREGEVESSASSATPYESSIGESESEAELSLQNCYLIQETDRYFMRGNTQAVASSSYLKQLIHYYDKDYISRDDYDDLFKLGMRYHITDLHDKALFSGLYKHSTSKESPTWWRSLLTGMQDSSLGSLMSLAVDDEYSVLFNINSEVLQTKINSGDISRGHKFLYSVGKVIGNAPIFCGGLLLGRYTGGVGAAGALSFGLPTAVETSVSSYNDYRYWVGQDKQSFINYMRLNGQKIAIDTGISAGIGCGFFLGSRYLSQALLKAPFFRAIGSLQSPRLNFSGHVAQTLSEAAALSVANALSMGHMPQLDDFAIDAALLSAIKFGGYSSFVTSAMLRRAMTNKELHGTYRTPLRFRNLTWDDLAESRDIKPLTIDELRSQKRYGIYKYTINEQGEPLFVCQYMRDGYGDVVEVKHPNIQGAKTPVVAAGEIIYDHDGSVHYVDNTSGHFWPTSPRLEKIVEHSFQRHGFKEARGKYRTRRATSWNCQPEIWKPKLEQPAPAFYYNMRSNIGFFDERKPVLGLENLLTPVDEIATGSSRLGATASGD